MIRYQWEFFASVFDEAAPLLRAHWDEIALNKDRVPLNIDSGAYAAMDAAGALKILTVRDGATLAGYVAFLIGPHPHYRSTLFASYDLFWLAPEHRRGAVGIRMFREAEIGLRAMGVKVIKLGEKTHFQAERGGIGKIFERLGYTAIETIYSKYVGD